MARNSDSLRTGDPYQDLANAIIVQQAQQYMKLLRKQKAYPYRQSIQEELDEIEDFFHSDEFALLTEADPDYILERMKQKVEDEDEEESDDYDI